MNLASIVKQLEKLAIDNSPAILTAVGVGGTITTAVLTGKATYKAALLINERENTFRFNPANNPKKRVYLDRVQQTWKLYIPAVSAGTMTVVSIVAANRIGTRRAAALAAAYSLSEKAAREYREKIAEKLTPHQDRKIKDELAQDRVNRNPANGQVIITGNGDVLCFDTPTGRYFKSNMETLRKAENDVNQQVIHEGSCPLSDFYSLLNLAATPYSEEVGWTIDQLFWLDFSTVLSDDSQPCIAISYSVTPIRGSKQQDS